jgi:hypothetical protein
MLLMVSLFLWLQCLVTNKKEITLQSPSWNWYKQEKGLMSPEEGSLGEWRCVK